MQGNFTNYVIFFFKEGVYVLNSLLFTDDALPHLSGYIISQNSKT